MTDKLDTLVSEVQNHIKDKRAELTALQTQARALQSAHADLHQEVEKAQTKLAEVRKALADSNKELDKRRAEASSIANSIIADAHDKKAAAEGKIRDLYAAGAKDIERATRQLRDTEQLVTAKRGELVALTNKVSAAQGELDALKKKARDWADA